LKSGLTQRRDERDGKSRKGKIFFSADSADSADKPSAALIVFVLRSEFAFIWYVGQISLVFEFVASLRD